jgi:hypothetical protein
MVMFPFACGTSIVTEQLYQVTQHLGKLNAAVVLLKDGSRMQYLIVTSSATRSL